MPACSSTPADANSIASQTTQRPSSSKAVITMDLLTNALNKGKAEIVMAPITQSVAVIGMVR